MPFGITDTEMKLAREAAVIAVKKYGFFHDRAEYERFIANPWNDHVSIQAAVEVIKLLRPHVGITS